MHTKRSAATATGAVSRLGETRKPGRAFRANDSCDLEALDWFGDRFCEATQPFAGVGMDF